MSSHFEYRAPGTVRLQVGDVVRLPADGFCAVVSVNESGALAEQLTRKQRTFTPAATGVAVTVSGSGSRFRMTRSVEAATRVARLGQGWKQKNFAVEVPGFLDATNNHPRDKKDNDSMKNNEQDGLPRGGLAADAIRAKRAAKRGKNPAAKEAAKADAGGGAAEDGTRTKGKLGQYEGHSICAVLRRLGKEGVSVAHARAIVAAQGWSASDTTVQIQNGWGRNDKAPAADLTKAQVKALVDSAPEPTGEAAEAKPAKKGRKSRKSAPEAGEPAAVAA